MTTPTDAQAPGSEPGPVLSLRDITMAFGPNEVLKGVSFDLMPGRVTALLGANGAGKSTLIKILCGVYTGSGGVIVVDGSETQIESPMAAARVGIQTVHQRIDESTIPGLTVAENLVFEELAQNQAGQVRSLRKLLPRAREIAATLDLNWPDSVLRTDVFELGIADRQLLLLARALIHRPRVLILDEPTSTLSESEVRRLFDVIRRLRDEGVAILYVSHHLSEVKTLADTLIVLRDGRVRDEQNSPFDMAAAVRSMLGEQVAVEAEKVTERRGEKVAMTLRGVQTLKRSQPYDLDLRFGEVTGIVGLIGAGKSELLRGIYGAEPLRAGTMTLLERPYAPKRTSDAVHRRVFLVPEDRSAEAMLPKWALGATATLPFLSFVSVSGVILRLKEKAFARRVIDDFNVVCTGWEQEMDALSGGNQQKVVVGRWLERDPVVMLLDEPFRGVDIGARQEISHKAREIAAAGSCVVVASSDVDEIREVADRIIVMVEGRPSLDAYTSQVDADTIVASMSEVA